MRKGCVETRLFSLAAAVVWVCCVSSNPAVASVFRDRPAFNAASQNLNTVDFESVLPNFEINPVIDGIRFQNLAGSPQIIPLQNLSTKALLGRSAGEITVLTIFLPPGITAVGCDQFGAPMIVTTSTGESVTMNPSDASRFVGFVSDQTIQTLTISLDFPEPTPDVVIDNLSFGQGRVGNEPPTPLLLVPNNTGRAAALDSVTHKSEPFNVTTTHNFAADGHTRITLFVVGLTLEPADSPFVKVHVEDSQQHVFDLLSESTARVKNLSWISQVTVRLPDTLVGVGNVNVSISVRGVMSNKALLRID